MPTTGPNLAFAVFRWEALEDGLGLGGPIDANLSEVIWVPASVREIAFVDAWRGTGVQIYQVAAWPGGPASRVARASFHRDE